LLLTLPENSRENATRMSKNSYELQVASAVNLKCTKCQQQLD